MNDIKNFQQMYRDGKVNRREFLAAMSAVGLSATAAGSLLTSASALAMTPKKGGTARYANNIHGPDDQMDPIVFTSGIDYARGRTTYNGLVQIRDDMVLAPELAEEWSVSSDAKEYTFKIRKGVTFHDGSPLTADDVVWSMNRHLGEDSLSTAKSFFATVKEWKKVDSHTVKAVLTSPDSDLPAKLGEKQTKVVKKDTVDFKLGNGTGPFVLESFEAGVRSTHVRNENYWREGANFDAVEITAITDPLARANALIAGDVDLINQVDAKSVALVEQSEGVRIVSTPSSGFAGICILKNTAPGENDDFVKGMQYIQDRERIVRSILKGHGTVGNDHPIGVAFGADHCAELPQREFDPDRAKFHLDKSGYTSAELFVAPVISGIEEVCLLMQANLKKIGFDLKIKKVPTDGYWGAVWMKEPLNVVSWNMRPTANAMLSIQFAPGAAWNDTFWNDDRFGELLKLQLAETNTEKRHEMLCEMQGLVNTGSGMVIPAHVNILDGVSDKIQGIPNVPVGAMGAYEWVEFAWKEA
jgi:peptide/nickel transport system substrate-binding protein